jgi:hypothetical protein
MKSLVPAALVIILEAGFFFSIAALPDRGEPAAAAEAVAAQVSPTRAPAAPAPRTRS